MQTFNINMREFFESAGVQFSSEQYVLFIENGGAAIYDDLVKLVDYHLRGGQSVVQSVGKLLLQENFSSDVIRFLKSHTKGMLLDKQYFAAVVNSNMGEKIFPDPPPDLVDDYVWREETLSSVEEYEQAFIAVGLEHKWPLFKEYLKPEIRLEVSQNDENNIPVGHSKIGGKPDLPATVSWPLENNEAPLSFLAQINLSEIDLTRFQTALPANGMLYFFYSSTQDFWGDNIDGADKFRSFYLKDTTELKRRDFPTLLVEGIFRACSVQFQYGFGLPNWEYDFIRENLEKSEQDPYIDISSVHNSSRTKLLGHANTIQGPMEFECERIAEGYTRNDAQNKEIRDRQSDWILLFQLDSERAPDMCWGDVGRLYFWIRKSDLINHDFEKTWLILQCG